MTAGVNIYMSTLTNLSPRVVRACQDHATPTCPCKRNCGRLPCGQPRCPNHDLHHAGYHPEVCTAGNHTRVYGRPTYASRRHRGRIQGTFPHGHRHVDPGSHVFQAGGFKQVSGPHEPQRDQEAHLQDHEEQQHWNTDAKFRHGPGHRCCTRTYTHRIDQTK
eukprot:1445672-Pyramimonas_sp.AAC.1